MSKEILCTLGPASMNDRVIARLEELGVSLFRINLSHTKIEDVAPVIDFVQARTKVPLCLDTEGAQIRTGAIAEGQAIVRDNSVIRVYRAPVPGDSQRLNFYPPDIVDCLELGDFVCIDFNTVLAQVIEREPGNATLRVVNGGTFGANKAVTVERAIAMPPLTEKDSAAMAIGREKGIRHVALSFANRGSDLDVIRAAALPDAFVISKIECRNGLINLDEITAKSDALLIDRGDLSREMPIERVPALQKWVTRRGKQAGRKVYVATNLLESMITASVPTRAEVNDVFNTLLDGVDGLVLAAETAIGA
ncbi:MAG: pyruvate kinase, partial [Alphaproteobacteria bacterium]